MSVGAVDVDGFVLRADDRLVARQLDVDREAFGLGGANNSFEVVEPKGVAASRHEKASRGGGRNQNGYLANTP